MVSHPGGVDNKLHCRGNQIISSIESIRIYLEQIEVNKNDNTNLTALILMRV